MSIDQLYLTGKISMKAQLKKKSADGSEISTCDLLTRRSLIWGVNNATKTSKVMSPNVSKS